MIKIVYHTEFKDKDTEIGWLRSQNIFPATETYTEWTTGAPMVRYGVIVSPEQALVIKLRHKLDIQAGYNGR